MDIYKIKNLPHDERMNILEGESFKIEEQDYMRPLEENELLTMKNELAQAMVQKGFLDNELKEIKDDFKSRIKPLNQQIGTAIMCLTHRMKNEHGKVYLVPDYENKMMHTVDSQGNVLNSRPLKPEERQFTIGGQQKEAV